jgi:hypothetical protein
MGVGRTELGAYESRGTKPTVGCGAIRADCVVLEAEGIAIGAQTKPQVNPHGRISGTHRLAEGLVHGIGGATVEKFVAHDPYRAGCRIKVHRTA